MTAKVIGGSVGGVAGVLGLTGLAVCWSKDRCRSAIARRFRGEKKEKTLKDVDDIGSSRSFSAFDESKMPDNVNSAAVEGVQDFVKVGKAILKRRSLNDEGGLLLSRDALTNAAEHAMERRRILYVKDA